jgi:outer membrane protein OmpA-like peptidoglycan-associated protein
MRAMFPTAALLLLIAGTADAQEKDHPLLTGYPGATITKKETRDFNEQIMLLSSINKDKTYKSETLEGRVTVINYDDPDDRSTLEKYKNYETALKEAGFEILWSCAGYDSCSAVGQIQIPGIGYFPYSDQGRNLTARLKRPEGDVWVGLQVKPAWTDLQIVEVAPMQTGMVKVSAESLGKGILSEGRVPVYDILFDTNKSDIKPESAETLREIAAMLEKNPTLKVHIVGHTDNVGDLAANLTLSKNRANAVVAALTTTHKVAAARLRADGVGPLAPVASNDTDAGRARNRRVELVKQ